MEQKTPKYTVEQLLEAIHASHLNLVVKEVDGDTVTFSEGGWKPLTIESDSSGVCVSRGHSPYEASIISSIKTALHILFDSNEVIY